MTIQRSVHFYPPDLAEDMKEDAGQKYRPSCGTEGEMFFENWCRQCARDKAMNSGAELDECDDKEVCDRIARSFAHNVDDPAYPAEWQIDKNGQPCCTAFVPVGEPIPEPRCERTIDMFEGVQ
jgi:hypothetical protein